MQEITNGPARVRQVVRPPPYVSLTTPQEASSAEYKTPGDPVLPGTRDLLTVEQERVMVEHLPIVRFIARRIHEG